MARNFWLLFCLAVIVNGETIEDHLCTNTSTSCGVGKQDCPASASCLSVRWSSFKPYAYKTNDGSLKGIIPGLFKNILDECCGTCWTVNLTEQNYIGLIDPNLENTSHVVFMSYSLTKEKYVNGKWFVPLIKDPSVVYITKRAETKKIPMQLIKAVWNAWPVLVVALLLSLHAGVVLWFLEFWRNPEQFPASFTRGSWEGFWWAFVSMTTVGYGDRAPQSILGRTFAIFWILIGICICSIFTATLTTALTTISLEEIKTLNRAKVGALRNSLEAIAGTESQAKVIYYNSSEALWKAFSQDAVEGILLDSYYSATPSMTAKIKADNLKISQTVTAEDWSHGIKISHSGLADCFDKKFQESYANSIFDLISEEIESEEVAENEATKRSSSIFDPTGDIFWPTFYACMGFTVIVIAFGVLWEWIFMKKIRGKKVSGETTPNGNQSNIDRMEKEMISEVQRLFAEWKSKMGEKPSQGNTEMIDLS